jgi:acyl dehydratase
MTPFAPPPIGTAFGPYERSWTSHEVMLYALGVGVGLDDSTMDVEYSTDNTRGVELAVLPTFSTIIGLPGTQMRWSELGIGDVTGLVHGEHDVVLHRSVPVAGAALLTGSLTGLMAKSSGVTIELTLVLADGDGPIADNRMTLFLRGATLGESLGVSLGGGDTLGERPDRDADTQIVLSTATNQALLYRLSGDKNRIHGDPAAAKRAGFERPILQGLSTFGFAARAVMRAAAERHGDGSTHGLASFGCRFARPVLPGDTLVTSVWFDGDRVSFETAVDGRLVLSHGRARFTSR